MAAVAFSSMSPWTAANAQDTGVSEITIQKIDAVQITKIDDWIIGVWTSTAVETGTFEFNNWDWQCVYSSTGAYSLDIQSANGGPQLGVVSSAGNRIRYTIRTASQTTASPGSLTYANYFTPSISLTGRKAMTSTDCSDTSEHIGYGANNLFFLPYVTTAEFNLAPPGIYRDVVTLTVSPE